MGSPTIPGYAVYDNEAFTVSGGGSGVGARSDQFAFVYRTLTGDGSLVARVASLQNARASAKAGIMIREALGTRSGNAFLLVSPAGVAFQRRLRSGASTVSAPASGAGPVWLKLDRRGAMVVASVSSDGVSWTTVASESVPMGAVVQAGLAVTSGTEVSAASATFTNVAFTPLAESAKSLPDGWTAEEIGNPRQRGAAAYDGGTFGMLAGGADIGGTSDQFHYAYTRADGDLDFIARVRVLGDSHPLARAGVMIRESLTATAAHASVVVSAGAGVAFQRRPVPGGRSVSTNGSASVAPVWVKLSVRGAEITAFESADGAAWTPVGTQTMTLPSPYYIGLASTSHSETTTTANIDSVQIQRAALSDQLQPTAPSVMTADDAARADDPFALAAAADTVNAAALPAGWTAADIGNPTPAGSSDLTGSTYTVTAGGSDIWWSADQFHFAYQQVTGDVDVIARVATLGQTDPWSKAGVMIRGSLAANSIHASMFTSSSNGTAFQRRTATAGDSAHTYGGPERTPVWLKVSRRGTTITASKSLNGTTWTTVGTITLALPAQAYVGLAVTSHNTTSTVNATFDNVQVLGTGANQPPSASLTAPANGATFTAPATVTVSATASDTDGTIARVDFYQGATLIGSDTSSPYSISWSNVQAGTYSLTARAVDDDGATTTSAARSITVNGPANQPPTVSLTAPANGATFTAPASVTVSATAADTDGTIARVDFYQGSTLIGSDTSSPFSVSWSGVQAGTYSLTARAVDDDGATTTSAARTITVTAPANQAPSVALTEPANGATYTAPATITVSATASDADGTVARVDFYQGSTLIGSDTSSPFSIAWSNVQVGSYTLTARATDNSGAVTTSAARTVTVSSASGLPPGWTAGDIGNPTPPGSTTATASSFTVTAGGSDIWGTSDQFHFVYQQISGDVDVTARVASLGTTNVWSKAGVMIRESLAANAAHATMFASTSNGLAFQRRATTGGNSDHTYGGSTAAPVWVRVSRRGSIVTALVSSNGTTWTTVGSVTLPLQAQAYVGLAVTSHNSTATVNATFDNVVVQGTSGNQAPAVSLTAPANGATFTAPAAITVSADASDTDGTIARVDFYQGSTLIGSDASSPYSISWNNVPVGTYSLTARAVDNGGATTTSAARAVNVNPAASPRNAVFAPSPDHNTLVTSYVFEVFAAGANPATATPIATQNIGKPPIVNGECTADVSATINALAPGNYQGTVTAVGSGGSSRSAPVAFTR